MGKGPECSPEERSIVKRLYEQNKTVAEISKLMKRSRCFVYNALKHCEKYSTMEKVKRQLRPRKTTSAQDRIIHRTSASDPFLTAKRIKNMLKESHNIEVSERTLRRRLNEFGLRGCVSRKVPLISSRNRQKRLKFAREHLNKPLKFWRNILWTDETKINLFSSDGKRYVRRPPNRARDPKYTTKTVKHGGGRIMLWAAISGKGVGPIVQIEGIMDQYVYKNILTETMIPYTDENMPVTWKFMQDNDPKHTSRVVKQCLSDNFVDVLDWPPQSPDLNPIENLWRTLKVKAGSRNITNLKDLWQVTKEAWNNIPIEEVTKLIDSMPRRCAEIIKNKGFTIPY